MDAPFWPEFVQRLELPDSLKEGLIVRKQGLNRLDVSVYYTRIE